MSQKEQPEPDAELTVVLPEEPAQDFGFQKAPSPEKEAAP